MTRKNLFIRVIHILPLLIVAASAQQLPRPESSPENAPDLQPATQATPTPTPERSALENLQNALNEQNTARPEAPADPNKPRTHKFTDQPVGTVLRALAEEAQISYIEPAMNQGELISLTLPSRRPSKLFTQLQKLAALESGPIAITMS